MISDALARLLAVAEIISSGIGDYSHRDVPFKFDVLDGARVLPGTSEFARRLEICLSAVLKPHLGPQDADFLARSLDEAHTLSASLERQLTDILERASYHSSLAVTFRFRHAPILVPAVAQARDLARTLDIRHTQARSLGQYLDFAPGDDRTADLRHDLDDIATVVAGLGRDVEPIRASMQDIDINDIFDPAMARAFDRALAPAFGRALARARALDRLTERAHASAYTLAAELASKLGQRLSFGAVGFGLGRLNAGEGFAAALEAGAMDDFSRANLSDIDLAKVDLAGIRWSERGTRWPPEIDIEQLRSVSKETGSGSGIYVITRPGGADRRREGVLA